MYKKTAIISVVMVVVLAFGSCINAIGLSNEEITAPSAIIVEASTGKVLYEKNSQEVRPCASITKVMTLLLVFEAIEDGKISLDDTVTASAHASSMGGSDIWLVEGESMTVDQMIKATVVASANDAAVALAELICGTEDEFVAKMNERAKELGMTKTVFKNCNGLDEDGHVTCAADVAIMSCELMKHKKIFDYTSIWLDYLRDGKTQIVNTNKLLKSYNGITGLKTGTTNNAGSCISASATRSGLSLNAVVLGCKSGTERFKDAATLLDYGFANYQVSDLKLPEDTPKSIEVEGGMQGSVNIKCDTNNQSIVVPKGAGQKVESKVEVTEKLTAPVKENQNVGKITYTVDGEKVAEFPFVTTNNVEQMSFVSVFSMLIGCLVAL